ncbi:MAG: TetR family transcriptional regulator [Blastococcus sp.]
MTAPSSSLRAARRKMSPEQRRQQIVSEAATLFDEAGYANATMDDIAKRVGVAKPTLYHYFNSKDEILQAIHEDFINLLITQHEQRRMTGLAPELLLLEVMGDVLELMETHRGHVRVFFEYHRQLPAKARPAIRQKRDLYEHMVEELIAAGIRRGSLKSVDPRLAMLATFGMCNWAYQWYRSGGDLLPREIAKHFWNYLMFGIGTPALDAIAGMNGEPTP